jgi:putative hemolysin
MFRIVMISVSTFAFLAVSACAATPPPAPPAPTAVVVAVTQVAPPQPTLVPPTQPSPTLAPTTAPAIGLPNPASVYCQQQGGKTDIRKTAAGEVGYCVFPDKSECEEWAFFRGECKPGKPATPAAATSPTGPCTLVASKAITAYSRPSLQATVFGELSAGERVPVGGTTDGWIGYEPGVAQAANVGPFRLRWVQKTDAIKLEGACGSVPVVASLPPTACFQMFMQATPILGAARVGAVIVANAKAGDYAQAIAASDQWLELDLNVGSLKQNQNQKGWIPRAEANFNGPCDQLPAVKP